MDFFTDGQKEYPSNFTQLQFYMPPSPYFNKTEKALRGWLNAYNIHLFMNNYREEDFIFRNLVEMHKDKVVSPLSAVIIEFS